MPADIRDFGEKEVNFLQNLLRKSVFANFCRVQPHTGACHYHCYYSKLCVKTFDFNLGSQVAYYSLPGYWFQINLGELRPQERRMWGFLDRALRRLGLGADFLDRQID